MNAKVLGVVVGLLALVALSQEARAGAAYPSGATCYTNFDGSGGCYGTLRSFRLAPSPYTYAAFYRTASSSAFYAYVDNRDFACQVPASDAALGAMFDRALAAGPDAYFWIGWGPNGTCHSMTNLGVSYYLP